MEQQLTNKKTNVDRVTKEMAGSPDHDLLIELKTRMEALRDDIKDLKDGTTVKIADHEVRLFSLENSKTKTNTLVSIGVGILTLLVGLLVYHVLGVKI